jgi:peptidoglycan/xylan/chitin deacetylase (PgdA/CDA1 family)
MVGAEPLTWDEIGHMHASGLVSIGAHTHSHLDLRTATPNQVEDEIARSDELIARNVGVVPQHFAYPWGYWGAEADPVLRSRYRSCVLGGSPSPRFDDVHLVPRIPVQSTDSFGGFQAKLRHGGRSEERLRRTLKGYRGP